MQLTYVHLSDIHFGQEKGSEVYVHDDVKQCLITDVVGVMAAVGIETMDGVIVTGDIAYSGKRSEYDRAARWLDRLTEAVGCEQTQVMVVPGNHDIDRDRISAGAELMLARIVEGGDAELDRFLADAGDRDLLYGKFADYRDFSEGYGCRLKFDGGVAINRRVAIAPERVLRFVGFNSALLCTGRGGDEGRLLIGGKQRVLPREEGEELVVLCHHPVESLQDEEVASRYIKSRARVHIYGHVHESSLTVENPVEQGDLLTLSAGAVVPPTTQGRYRYTYNVLRFEWDAETDGLKVEVVPRSWDEDATIFDADTTAFGDERVEKILRCPNFRRLRRVDVAAGAANGEIWEEAEKGEVPEDLPACIEGGKNVAKDSDLLRLRFFRDLSGDERIQALIKVGLLPESWTIDLTHSMERRLMDRALALGLRDELATAVTTIRNETAAAPGEEG